MMRRPDRGHIAMTGGLAVMASAVEIANVAPPLSMLPMYTIGAGFVLVIAGAVRLTGRALPATAQPARTTPDAPPWEWNEGIDWSDPANDRREADRRRRDAR